MACGGGSVVGWSGVGVEWGWVVWCSVVWLWCGIIWRWSAMHLSCRTRHLVDRALCRSLCKNALLLLRTSGIHLCLFRGHLGSRQVHDTLRSKPIRSQTSPSNTILSKPIQTHTSPSNTILSKPIQTHPSPSNTILSKPIQTHPSPPDPIQSFQIKFNRTRLIVPHPESVTP